VAQEVVEAAEAVGQEEAAEAEAKKEEKSQDALGLSRQSDNIPGRCRTRRRRQRDTVGRPAVPMGPGGARCGGECGGGDGSGPEGPRGGGAGGAGGGAGGSGGGKKGKKKVRHVGVEQADNVPRRVQKRPTQAA
jgi:hypothetical protein